MCTLNPLETLAEYVAKAHYDNLPGQVVEQANFVILDTIGCALGGARTGLGRVISDTIKSLGGNPEATMIGQRTKTNCVFAAHVNSILADALDFEDTYHGLGHPSATIIPAALSVAERSAASGKELITAVVCAYETSMRLGLTMRPCTRKGKFGSFQYWHTFGATAAASKILKLNADEIMAAFGYAGASAPLPTYVAARPLSWIKDNFGEATAAGVLGALLAEKGYIAPRSPDLEYWYKYDSEKMLKEKLTGGLGTEYVILLTGFKPYSACRFLHSALGALETIMRTNRITPSQVEKVVLYSHKDVAEDFAVYRPENMVDAEFSFPYVAAAMMLGKKPGLDWYSAETMSDPEILEMARRIEIRYSEESDRLLNQEDYKKRRVLAEVEVFSADGKHYQNRSELSKGDPQDPLTRPQLLQKFNYVAASAGMPEDRILKTVQAVTGLQTLLDVRELGSLLFL